MLHHGERTILDLLTTLIRTLLDTRAGTAHQSLALINRTVTPGLSDTSGEQARHLVVSRNPLATIQSPEFGVSARFEIRILA